MKYFRLRLSYMPQAPYTYYRRSQTNDGPNVVEEYCGKFKWIALTNSVFVKFFEEITYEDFLFETGMSSLQW